MLLPAVQLPRHRQFGQLVYGRARVPRERVERREAVRGDIGEDEAVVCSECQGRCEDEAGDVEVHEWDEERGHEEQEERDRQWGIGLEALEDLVRDLQNVGLALIERAWCHAQSQDNLPTRGDQTAIGPCPTYKTG